MPNTKFQQCRRFAQNYLVEKKLNGLEKYRKIQRKVRIRPL